MADDKTRSRNWFLTINNYSDYHLEYAKAYKCGYILIADEVGDKCKTPHLHIYFELVNQKTFSKIKKNWPTANIQVAKGTVAQIKAYLSKQNLIYEFGEPKTQGKRTDLDKAKEVLEETGKMAEVVKVATSYQSVRMCECYLKYHERKRNWKPKVEWYYGSTGSGKSKTAYEVLGGIDNTYTTGKSIKWWEGYDGHENVVIDDFREKWCEFPELLKLLDRYPYMVECKGGSRQFLGKHIIITSSYSPEDVYDTTEDINQLMRRIDKIKIFGEYTKNGEESEGDTD
jgi:hypothetical protein